MKCSLIKLKILQTKVQKALPVYFYKTLLSSHIISTEENNNLTYLSAQNIRHGVLVSSIVRQQLILMNRNMTPMEHLNL